MSWSYIFHVIGTLDMGHVANAMESLRRQKDPGRFERFVLYNGSPLDTDEILSHVPDLFDERFVFDYDPRTPKGAVADWTVQMKEITGTDRYLCHKADFYLGENTCRNLRQLSDQDFFVLFKKVDMKERATVADIQALAQVTWPEIKADPMIGRYPILPGVPDDEHVGKLGVIWDGYPLDATMHAYSESFRPHWTITMDEFMAKHIWLRSLHFMFQEFPYLILDDAYFALHQWHEVPEKLDVIKLTPGERF